MKMDRLVLLTVFLVFGFTNPGYAQNDHGFRFIRIQYGQEVRGWRGRGGQPWAHDYPTAELNFYEAIERTTKIQVAGPPLIMTLKDERIFEYPLLYLCEPGYWQIDEAEADNLREYLERGGFILFDDFRGTREWANLYDQLKMVFPDREPVLLPEDHAIWNIYFEVDPVAAPSLVSGRFSDFDDRYFALFDDNERMMALICYNQDVGDGWEWPDMNFQDASLIAFQMGVNFLMYALTH